MESKKYLGLLFNQNSYWATSVEAQRPGYFTRLLNQQNPQYLWIGCSDSRAPANIVVGLEPGELFVHRNIANVVAPSDLNCLSVIQFALEVLKVKHIMVVGHHACSGVDAALDNRRVGLADNWLRYVQAVRDKHEKLLSQLNDPRQRKNALCDLNAIEQAVHVCKSTVVSDAWAREQKVHVHGLVYAIHRGLMLDLNFVVSSEDSLQEVYEHAIYLLYERYLGSQEDVHDHEGD